MARPCVTHIAYHCRDRETSERFYTEHFGVRRSRVFNPGKPDELILLKLGSVRLEFFRAPAGSSRPETGPVPGYAHLAFEVDSLEKTIQALNADNVPTGPIIDCADALKGLRVCFFKDPDGNSIEIMQGYRDER
jgi:glyoxylase I family protein